MPATTTAPSATTPASLGKLCDLVRQGKLLESSAAILGWDQETMMPPEGVEHRSRQLAQLAKLAHGMLTDPKIGELLAKADTECASHDPLSRERVNLREIRRDYERSVKLPADLVEELAEVSSKAQHEWAEARRDSDFARFRPWLEKIVKLNRRKAECFGWDRTSGEPWDALSDSFEPGCTARMVEGVFTPLRKRLVALLDRVDGASKRPSNAFNDHELPIEAQERFSRMIAGRIGFDFNRGRLDRSTHPFCGGSHCRDVRMTSRYAPRCVLDGLGSTMHESGHGMYEQGLLPEWIGLPMGEAVSLSVHESQSRLWENQVGRSQAFWRWCHGTLPEFFGSACDRFSPEEIYGAANLVERGLIRVDADEATYNLHVIVRFTIERRLLDESLPVADLPQAWNELYRDIVGVKVPDDRRGCLQDVHWSMGAIGYFPTYTLGTLYAAQFFDAARRDLPGLEEGFARGEFAPLLAWLRTHIHSQGRRYLPEDLCKAVTGATLSADPFMRYLEGKLAPLYGL
ncbi:MAG: carboxypeptidase M32 [Phycisphaeraceae bacterium]|nr:carboxypeptidase M32 [Phycisphaeraceae bacterium]